MRLHAEVSRRCPRARSGTTELKKTAYRCDLPVTASRLAGPDGRNRDELVEICLSTFIEPRERLHAGPLCRLSMKIFAAKVGRQRERGREVGALPRVNRLPARQPDGRHGPAAGSADHRDG